MFLKVQMYQEVKIEVPAKTLEITFQKEVPGLSQFGSVDRASAGGPKGPSFNSIKVMYLSCRLLCSLGLD